VLTACGTNCTCISNFDQFVNTCLDQGKAFPPSDTGPCSLPDVSNVTDAGNPWTCLLGCASPSTCGVTM
jgi:hypothetical protein